jgi:hypothetical protein
MVVFSGSISPSTAKIASLVADLQPPVAEGVKNMPYERHLLQMNEVSSLNLE